MTKGTFPLSAFSTLETPFYYYDIELLRQTLEIVRHEAKKRNFVIHYAIKANANKRILREIASYGLGADCVSGNEIIHALECGFAASKITFAGVGKTYREIMLALENDIFCFNVESLQEIEAIEKAASEKKKKARVALRINPNINADTHQYITTGLSENKFGLNQNDIASAIDIITNSLNIELIGIHFHIGSQITHLNVFADLCHVAEVWEQRIKVKGIELKHINMGGGLGINYDNPNIYPIADFSNYFQVFEKGVKNSKATIHFELGRAIVGQCGSLITRTTYIKQGENKMFLIVDAGMNDLIRPALYQASHRIENISSNRPPETYDVVGPICESSDVFGKNVQLNRTQQNDILAIRSAGAYGESMASQYNCRELITSYFSDSL